MTQKPTIIAEAGVNHNGDVNRAIDLVRAARDAGASIVKFQAFSADDMAAKCAPTAEYQATQTEKTIQTDLLRELELSPDNMAKVAEACCEAEIEFLCTPFDTRWLSKLMALGVKRLKVGSGELTNLPLLGCFSETGLPIILSTGMSNLEEVEDAVTHIRNTGDSDITLMQCTSLYPAPVETLNLKVMSTLREHFSLPVGFSDHSVGYHVTLASVALGAEMIEKHLTLDRSLPGPDHGASLEPGEFATMVKQIEDVCQSLGHGRKEPHPDEQDTANVVRRSWHMTRDLPVGHTIRADDVKLLRPLGGLSPNLDPIGIKLTQSVAVGSALSPGALADIPQNILAK